MNALQERYDSISKVHARAIVVWILSHCCLCAQGTEFTSTLGGSTTHARAEVLSDATRKLQALSLALHVDASSLKSMRMTSYLQMFMHIADHTEVFTSPRSSVAAADTLARESARKPF